MSFGPSCGLWPGERGMYGAVVDPDGLFLAAQTIWPTEEGDEVELWLDRMQREFGPGLELVVTPRLARRHSACRVSLALGRAVWVAPSDLVALIAAAAWSRPTPRNYALTLARLPLNRTGRSLLRRLPADPGPRQLAFRLG